MSPNSKENVALLVRLGTLVVIGCVILASNLKKYIKGDEGPTHTHIKKDDHEKGENLKVHGSIVKWT